MSIASFAVLTISGVLTPFAASQESQDPVVPARTYTPVEVAVGPVQAQEVESQRDHRFPLTAQSYAVDQQDDNVPLPNPAVGEAGPGGDVLVRPASGDPYFLGFTGGLHYPPASELIDPLVLQRYQPGMDSRPGDFTYAFVMFSKRMTEARLARLEALGCRLLGFHPHYTMKVALPPSILPDVSILPFVRWVGQAQDKQKIDPHLVSELTESPESRINVVVDLFESDLNADSVGTPVGTPVIVEPGLAPYRLEGEIRDYQPPRMWMSNGWMQRRLSTVGLEVQWYNPRSMSIQGWIEREKLSLLVDLDFVQCLETVPTLVPAAAPHDESIAMIAADRIRSSYPGDTNQVAVVGIQDSGIEHDHFDLSGTPGVPLWGWGWDCSKANEPWDDDSDCAGCPDNDNGHGTHVAGTILGRGIVDAGLRGVAPGLATWGEPSAIFNLRVFADAGDCTWSHGARIDVFQSPITWSSGNVTPRPHLINNSWGDATKAWKGTEALARTYDSAVYDEDQVWIFCAGNDGGLGASSMWLPAGAKNVLTVGSVDDFGYPTKGEPGDLSEFSSKGPMLDGRWKPNVVAPGCSIRSLLANDNDAYFLACGTSMATPHVSGVAATLVDHYSWLRYDPARMSAVLMATAITKNDQVLASPGSAHHNTYGAGRVSAYKAHWGTNGFDQLGTWSYVQDNTFWKAEDFTVPSGTTRLVAVMHYVEEACSSGASQALVNDYDLWLDRDPVDTVNGNTGDYSIHQSAVDNTEIRIIDSPASGAWRWKVYPENATGKPVKMAVVIYAIYGDTTPDATLTLAIDDSTVQPDETVNVVATIDPTDYIASAVVLDRSGSIPVPTQISASTTMYDGTVTDLTSNANNGRQMLLGDVIYFLPRAGTWGLSYDTEGTMSITVNARSDNMVDKTATLNVIVDGTEPGAVTNLNSTSHTKTTWSNNPNITWTWSAASDSLSGLQGYGIDEDWACTLPITSLDLGTVTSYTGGPYPSSTQAYQFNIRSVDRSDNWDSDYVCDGPYFIDVDAPGIATFNSSDHTVGGKSCNPSITVSWNPAADAHSGVFGYDVQWSQIPITCPFSGTSNWQTQSTTTLAPGTWWCHVRAVDKAGNWATCTDAAHFGPFTIVPTCTLFSDDFESGDFAAGGWAISGAGRCVVSSKSAFNSFFGARLKKGGQGTGPCLVGTKQTWIRAPAVDTTGWSGVRVDMNARVKRNTLGCEGMALQWWDGSGWNLVGIIEKHAWAPYSFDLPAAALGNPALTMRLITNSKGKGERAEVDNFTVTGIE